MRLWPIFLLFIALTLPAACQTPDSVVRKLYAAHIRNPNLEKTVDKQRDCFTPSFLDIMRRALAKPAGGEEFVDFDFFLNTQDGGYDFEMGATKLSGKQATVNMQIYQRGDYRNPKPDPNWRKKRALRPMQVLLVDEGHGFKIQDIKFLTHDQRLPDGSVQHVEGMSVRETLTKIANSK